MDSVIIYFSDIKYIYCLFVQKHIGNSTQKILQELIISGVKAYFRIYVVHYRYSYCGKIFQILFNSLSSSLSILLFYLFVCATFFFYLVLKCSTCLISGPSELERDSLSNKQTKNRKCKNKGVCIQSVKGWKQKKENILLLISSLLAV